jgi:hypothetical protein
MPDIVKKQDKVLSFEDIIEFGKCSRFVRRDFEKRWGFMPNYLTGEKTYIILRMPKLPVSRWMTSEQN